MVLDAAVYGGLLTAACGLLAAIVAKLRCRFLLNNEEGVTWSLACGFSEHRLPPPDSKSIEVYPLERDTLYIKKNS